MSVQYIIASLSGKQIKANIGGEGQDLLHAASQIDFKTRIQLLKEPYDIQFTQDSLDSRAYFHLAKMRKAATHFPDIAKNPNVIKGYLGDLLDQSVLFNIYQPSEIREAHVFKWNEMRGYLVTWPGYFEVKKGKIMPGVFIHDFAVFPQAGDNRIVLKRLLFEYAEAAAKAMKAKVLYLTAETQVYDKFLRSIGFSKGMALKNTVGHSLYSKMLSLGALAVLTYLGFGNQKEGQTNA